MQQRTESKTRSTYIYMNNLIFDTTVKWYVTKTAPFQRKIFSFFVLFCLSPIFCPSVQRIFSVQSMCQDLQTLAHADLFPFALTAYNIQTAHLF